MLELVKVADNVKGLLCGSMKDWERIEDDRPFDFHG